MALIDVVQWKGTPDVFAWRFPENNLTTFTQLVVNESQEAVLFSGGKLLRKFGPGRHTLSTENIPLLENLFGIPFGGENPFTAEVWFVNRVAALDVKWGTQQPFLVRDPQYGVVLPVRGFGQFGIRIEDSETFLVELVGTLPLFDKQRMVDYFRGMLLSRATGVIAGSIREQGVSVLDIASCITALSQALQEQIGREFARFGIRLVNFYLSGISVPEDDPDVRSLRATLAKRAEMDVLRFNYQQERSFDVLEKASANEGAAGTLLGAGMGLGMGLGAGGAVGGMMQGLAAQVRTPLEPLRRCPQCGAEVSGEARFCSSCGARGASVGAQASAGRMLCDRCGKEIPPGAKFCPFCGDAYRPCPMCGADVPEHVGVCPACGGALPAKCTCGARVEAGAKFCPGCGKPQGTTCPSCGAVSADGARFCSGCGAEIKE